MAISIISINNNTFAVVQPVPAADNKKRVSFPADIIISNKESETGSNLRKASYSSELTPALRSMFAVSLWHCGVVQDAMAVGTHLKFDKNLARPTVSAEVDAPLTAFTQPPPHIGDIRQRDNVYVCDLSRGSQRILMGTVVDVKEDFEVMASHRELRIGQRLEAKDRLNPRMICKLIRPNYS